jgi:hypothetical protein
MKNMITKPQLRVRIGMMTFGLIISVIISVITTTLVFQGHIHPDYWTTNKYDVAGILICVLVFIFIVRSQVKKSRVVRASSSDNS